MTGSSIFATTLTANVQDTQSSDLPPLTNVIVQCYARVSSFLSESHPADTHLAAVQRQVRNSLSVIATALSQYQLSELSLSYNGGKDCLVLLVLLLASLHIHGDRSSCSITDGVSSISGIHVRPSNPFPALDDFVHWSARACHLDLVEYSIDPPRSSLLSNFKDYCERHPYIKAIFAGTRRTDPHGLNLTHFDRTNNGWPDFVRVHPVIDWHYSEVWTFILHLGLRYCSLYDQGYTSLGGLADTLPNPMLQIHLDAAVEAVEEDMKCYRPAYQLAEDLQERLGRS